MSDDLAALTSEFRRRVADLGYELVDVRWRGSGRRPLVQARIDIPNSSPGHGVTVADCAKVSRALEEWLDAGGALGDRYVLEVSSPGIERPVRWPEDWQRFVGRDVRVRLEGQGRIRATIVRVADDGTAVELRPVGGKKSVTVLLAGLTDAQLAADWD